MSCGRDVQMLSLLFTYNFLITNRVIRSTNLCIYLINFYICYKTLPFSFHLTKKLCENRKGSLTEDKNINV